MVEKWVPAEWSHYYRHWTERSDPAKSNNYAQEHQEHHMEGQGTQGLVLWDRDMTKPRNRLYMLPVSKFSPSHKYRYSYWLLTS